MNDCRGSIIRTLILGYLIFGFGIYAAAQCRAPHYHAVRSLNTDVGVLRISIQPRDFGPENLICLVQTLKERHPRWKSILLQIYGSQYAAQVYTDPGSEAPSMRYRPEVQPHALYSLDPEKKENALFLFPFGWWDTPESESTEIDLPVSGRPHCRVAICDRCLMIALPVEYPYAALKEPAWGKVTLEGIITSEGKVADIRVQNIEVNQSAEGKLLAEAAEQNLASWQLEPRRGQDPLQITYSYILDPSLGRNLTDFRFDLPTQIVIRGSP